MSWPARPRDTAWDHAGATRDTPTPPAAKLQAARTQRNPQGCGQAKGLRTLAQGVLEQKGWRASSERDALGSFLPPESLPQFPHIPEDAPSGEAPGGAGGGLQPWDTERPKPQRRRARAVLPALWFQFTALPVAATGSPDSLQGVPGTPAPRPRGGRARSRWKTASDFAWRVPSRSSPPAAAGSSSPVASCPLAGTLSPSRPEAACSR